MCLSLEVNVNAARPIAKMEFNALGRNQNLRLVASAGFLPTL
jgi:hypothetical protein